MAKPTKHGDKWRIRWLDERGKRQSTVFDDYKRAQAELSRRQVEVEEIRRGVRNAPPPEKTLGDLFDYWVEKRAVRKRSKKDDESIIRRHLRPAFGTMKLRDFGAEDVDSYVNAKIDDEELSEKTVSNHVTLLGTMLRAAANFRIPWMLHVPRLKKPRVSLFGTDYQWLRSDDEIGRFLAAAQGEDEHVFVFYTVAIFTGMRAGEIAALEWPDVDFERRLIAVQRSFDGPTKSDRVRYVPIPDTWSSQLRGHVPARPARRRLGSGSCTSPTVSLPASFPRSVALTQLRFASIRMTSFRRDLHPQDSAHAGRTRLNRGIENASIPRFSFVL